MTTKTLSDSTDGDEDHNSAGYACLTAEEREALALLEKEEEKKREKLRFICAMYAFYSVADGFSLSSSLFRYFFDILQTDSSTSSLDHMHEWMMTPSGLIITASLSLSLIVFDVLGNIFDDEDKDLLKKHIAIIWPYCRDTIKGLKNAYKGIRATVDVIQLLGGLNLNYLTVPVSLILGGLSVFNRIWNRKMVSDRKAMMKFNADILKRIQTDKLTLEALQELAKAQEQTMAQRRYAFLSAVYSGFIDGLYLYVGVLSVCSLAPPALIIMTVFCGIYFLSCIATRVYEEYDYQRKLLITKAKVDLAYYGKKLELLFVKLQTLEAAISLDAENSQLLEQWKELEQEFAETIKAYKDQREELRALSTLSYTSAALSGLRDGLAAYGALGSMMFAIATILVLASVPFPPAFLISCVSLGIVFLIGFVAYSLFTNYQHQLKQREELEKDCSSVQLAELENFLKDTEKKVRGIQPEQVKEIFDGKAVDPSPQFYFQELFEIVRAFFSGFPKGEKNFRLATNNFQELDEQGHYQDTPIMYLIVGCSVLLHTLAFSIRAYLRYENRRETDAAARAKEMDPETDNATEEIGDGDKFQPDEIVPPLQEDPLDAILPPSPTPVPSASASRYNIWNEKTTPSSPRPRTPQPSRRNSSNVTHFHSYDDLLPLADPNIQTIGVSNAYELSLF